MRFFHAEMHGLADERWRRRLRSKPPAAAAGLACVIVIAWYSMHHGPFAGIWRSEADFEDEPDYVELAQNGPNVVAKYGLDMSAIVTSFGLSGKVWLECCKDRSVERKCPGLWGAGGRFDFHLTLSPDGRRLSGEYLATKYDDVACIDTGKLEWSPWVLTRVR